MITVACVYRTGGVYTREWVHALRRQLWGKLPGVEFKCLTNDPGVEAYWRVPLRYEWRGWWSKMALFEPGLFSGPVLYMDLDTLIVGNLAEISAYRGPLAMLSDFYRPDLAQSGVMMWTPGPLTDRIWARWSENPDRYMREFRGDGQWLHAHVEQPDRLQDLFPDQIVSYKVHARDGIPPAARLVCAHGTPKWDDPAAGWAHEYWSRKLATYHRAGVA